LKREIVEPALFVRLKMRVIALGGGKPVPVLPKEIARQNQEIEV
jgi:hypothetical protein